DVLRTEADGVVTFLSLVEAIQNRQTARSLIIDEFSGRLGTESVNGIGAPIFEAEIGLIGTSSSPENIDPGSMSVDADPVVISLELNESEIEPVKAVVVKAVITVGENEVNARYF